MSGFAPGHRARDLDFVRILTRPGGQNPGNLSGFASGIWNRPRTSASDIYAFGCVCLEEPAVIYQVVQGVRPNRPAGNIIPDHIWKITEKCWAHNFADRPSILGILLELEVHDRPSDGPLRVDTGVIAGGQMSPRNTSPRVMAALTPFSGFIDPNNPQEYYIRREKIAEGSDGTSLCVARLADVSTERLMLPTHIKEQDRLDRLAYRTTFVAIKTVLIPASGNATLSEVLRELCIMRDLRCKNVLTMDALYVDPVEDILWIRMELMIRPLSSVIELCQVGLTLPDRTIAGCIKDVISALEYLRMNDIAPRNIRSNNIMINNQGVLKLTNLSTAVRLSTSSSSNSQAYQVAIPPSTNIASNACSLGALVWEMATGEHRSINTQEDLEERPLSIPTFHEFIQMCFDLEDWSPLSSIASRTPVFRHFIRMCFEPAVTSLGYHQLVESSFIRDACERTTLAQLLMQCSTFEQH
ncbi:kinase-like domain-containing protein [Mycena alexandri]|uniref:Kinase-like domain-containing protein n=1 Tax=Mycena alexandri TaxID=1745969 RepID=A0AAD6S3W7_9AGAR|nr:kinase-like domain-containing protein [Mycena alexandri]